MKLSHERMVHLSHLFLDLLRSRPDVEFLSESAEIRMRIVKILKDEAAREERMEAAVRHKIVSQKRLIPEGSQEWEILFRKYYDEEFHKQYGSRD